jgi:hypothetical protein
MKDLTNNAARAPTSLSTLLHVILEVIRPLTRGERPDKRSKDSYTKCTDICAPHVLLLGIQPCLVVAFIDPSRVKAVGSLEGSNGNLTRLGGVCFQLLYLKLILRCDSLKSKKSE